MEVNKMKTSHVFLKLSGLTLLGFLVTGSLASCAFCLPEGQQQQLCRFLGGPTAQASNAPPPAIVFEEPGTVIAYHGFACAESDKNGTEEVLQIEQSLTLPPYATNATVFLNGWELQYLRGDHHVRGLGTLIGNIRVEGQTLKWRAGGALSDRNFDDGYAWCHFYTAVAWNDATINLTVDHKDGICDATEPVEARGFVADNENTGIDAALTSFPSFLQNPAFTSKTVAILPRGFGIAYEDCDHHLRQLAYNLEHSEPFIEKDKSYRKKDAKVVPLSNSSGSAVDLGFVSWETSAIVKDNDTRRDYKFGELVSGLGGNDVGIIQPPFSILPLVGSGVNIGRGHGVVTREFAIEQVPFQHALPMLTGWDVGYQGGDHHVQEIGVWIDEIHYDKDPIALTGTLRYKLSSVLRDDDSEPDFFTRHKITVLGLKAVSGGIPSQKTPDLVALSPLGTDPNAFCRIEGGNLRVSVTNQGNEQASASKTRVIFSGEISVTLDTPSLPAGGSVDLLFKVPAGCSSPDCSFNITVDANNQINEATHEANNTANGTCIG
jgi:hypothetical protein